jgi:oligopeptide transport system ATP-binding protein
VPAGPLLEVDGLCVEFRLRRGVVRAVDGLSYDLHQGETLAIVGESGSGKTVAAYAVMGVLTTPPASVTAGTVKLRGRDILGIPESEHRRLRGAEIAMVAQNASLNPVFPVGWQIGEPLRVHLGMSRRAARARAVELMDRVGIPSAKSRVDHYPHQFSGGMRQRVSIAMAMALDPAVLIADEPTTALDVTVQAQIMRLLADVQAETGMALVLITHDLGLVSESADRVVVMYAGRECETGTTEEVFTSSRHPYTLGLMQSVPGIGAKRERLAQIGGAPPDLMNVPSGCAFHPRCAMAVDYCVTRPTVMHDIGSHRGSSCHRHEEVCVELIAR